jgi:hypothetical protein
VATDASRPIAFLVAATSANTSSSNRDCNGVSERTISYERNRRPRPLVPRYPAVRTIKSAPTDATFAYGRGPRERRRFKFCRHQCRPFPQGPTPDVTAFPRIAIAQGEQWRNAALFKHHVNSEASASPKEFGTFGTRFRAAPFRRGEIALIEAHPSRRAFVVSTACHTRIAAGAGQSKRTGMFTLRPRALPGRLLNQDSSQDRSRRLSDWLPSASPSCPLCAGRRHMRADDGRVEHLHEMRPRSRRRALRRKFRTRRCGSSARSASRCCPRSRTRPAALAT